MEERPEFSSKGEEEKPTETPSPPPVEEPSPPPPMKEPSTPPPVETPAKEHDVALPVAGKRIIVDFSEKEECVLGPMNEVTFYEGTAVLTVENPCISESLWNINIDLSQTEGTADFRSGNYLATDLDGGNEWKKPYKLMSTSPILQVLEQVDTDYNEGVDPNFARHELIAGVETSTLFQITLTNRHQKPINKVALTKEIPAGYEVPPRFLAPYLGEVEFDQTKSTVTWTLTNLASDQPVKLSIVATCTPSDVEPINTGTIDVDYEVLGSNMVSIEPTVKSLCDVFFFVETAESEEPGQWHCTAEFEGNSELQTFLESVKVSLDETTVFTANPNEDVPAKGSWTADFQVKGGKPPVFQKEMMYYVPWAVKRSITSHIKKRSDILPVIKTSTTKTFDPPIVNTYARTLVNVDASVTNIGSAVINKLVFHDNIPGYFQIAAGTIPQVLLGEENVTDLATIDLAEVELEEEKSLSVTVTELVERHGGLKPDQILSLHYVLEAAKPVPGRHYNASFQSNAYAQPPASIPALSEARTPRGPPEIEIKYEKRAIGVGKAVRKTSDGYFIIRIRVKNNGGVPLESIVVTDRVPLDFECSDIEPKTIDSSETVEGDMRLIAWKLPRLDSEQSVTLKFKTRGKTGEFVQKEPTVEVQG